MERERERRRDGLCARERAPEITIREQKIYIATNSWHAWLHQPKHFTCLPV